MTPQPELIIIRESDARVAELAEFERLMAARVADEILEGR